MVTVEPFPLRWPEGWPRTPAHKRGEPRFDSRLAPARDGLLLEIRRLGGRNTVITSNLPLRLDGLPYANRNVMGNDVGVAVYWEQTVQGRTAERVMACDRWTSVGANMRAIALSIAALRGIDRWGSSTIVERALAGFAALPAAPEAPDWRQVLRYPTTLDEARRAYRELARTAHPDHGGSPEQMRLLNAAWETAQREMQ